MKSIKTLLIGVIVVTLFGCSSQENQYSPDQVIKNALEKTESLESYYAEADMITRKNDEVIEQIRMKEWQATDGKRRIETENKDDTGKTIAVNDGKELTTYMVDENQVFVIDGEDLLDQTQRSLKDEVYFYLESIRETHDIKVQGEEEVIGRKTQRFTAKPKEAGTLIGEQEIWIDQENWLVLKLIVQMGDTETEFTYTEVDLNPKFSEDLFELDIPEDAEIQSLDDTVDMSEISLEEVTKSIGYPVLHFPEKDGLEISTVEKTELYGEFERTEVQIDYAKDGKPYLTMFVFETPEDVEGDLDFMDEETVEIRGKEGAFMDESVMRLLSWQEDGMSYSVDLVDSNITLEDIIEMTENMELTTD